MIDLPSPGVAVRAYSQSQIGTAYGHICVLCCSGRCGGVLEVQRGSDYMCFAGLNI